MDNIRKSAYILELTKKCNNNCLYCYNVWKADKNYPKNELNLHEWKIVINKIFKDNKPNVIGISGGEPLLNNDAYEIIKYIKKGAGYFD